MDDARELLSCPHCGGEAKKSFMTSDERGGYVTTCSVSCADCLARTHGRDGTDANGWSKDKTAEAKAVAAWNRRVSPGQ